LEKFASYLVLKHMDGLRGLYSSRVNAYRNVLVACVEGEVHSIGARMVADLLDIEGSAVDFLKVDVPMSESIEILEIRRPDLVALSVRTSNGLDMRAVCSENSGR
jgi:MerR family transcriptional regulator, light-induced transcriptional regulator